MTDLTQLVTVREETTHGVEHVLPDMSKHAGERGSQQVYDTAGPVDVLAVFLQVVDILEPRRTRHTFTDIQHKYSHTANSGTCKL